MSDLSNVAEPWRSLILKTAASYPNVDPRLVAATLYIENRGWPDFNRTDWPTSSASAQGPWQFIPSTWKEMGRDENGDGIANPNDPEDAVHAAFRHQEGSAGKPIVTGFTGSLEAGLNLTFSRNTDNLLAYMAKYNGRGAPGGVAIKDLPRNENSDYVYMAYYVLASNFTLSYDRSANRTVDMTASATDGSTGATPASCVGGAGFVDTNGHSFPVALTKGDVSSGYNWPCVGTCHHDGSPAFDLAHKDTVRAARGSQDHATVGVAVYAIHDGTIDYARNNYAGQTGCYSMMLTSSDGWRYWYGHIANPTVRAGQKVAAGEKIAEIGRRACTGNGSYPHLHIDRGSPKGAGGGRVNSRDPEFVPLMNQLYQNLPG